MKITLIYLILSIYFGACNRLSTEKSNSETEIQETESGNDKAACLLSYQTKYDQLLPLDIIQKHYKADMKTAKKKYNFRPEAKRHDQDTYEYTWESGRSQKIKMMGREMEVPSPNRIGLSWVGSDLFKITGKPTPLESFKAFYRNATAVEKEAAFKKADEVLKEKGYGEKTSETASNMAKDLSTDEIIFLNITGVGEAASWRIKEKQLTVLVGNVTFQVIADVGIDDKENIALAKKLALEVLNKCK